MRNGGTGLYVSAKNKYDLEAVKAGLQAMQTMRLGLYGLAAVFAIACCIVILFAPEGRDVTSGIVAVALCVLAGGCAGYGTLGLKTPLATLQAAVSDDAKDPSASRPPQSN